SAPGVPPCAAPILVLGEVACRPRTEPRGGLPSDPGLPAGLDTEETASRPRRSADHLLVNVGGPVDADRDVAVEVVDLDGLAGTRRSADRADEGAIIPLLIRVHILVIPLDELVMTVPNSGQADPRAHVVRAADDERGSSVPACRAGTVNTRPDAHKVRRQRSVVHRHTKTGPVWARVAVLRPDALRCERHPRTTNLRTVVEPPLSERAVVDTDVLGQLGVRVEPVVEVDLRVAVDELRNHDRSIRFDCADLAGEHVVHQRARRLVQPE